MMPPRHKRFLRALYAFAHVEFDALFWSERRRRIPERVETSRNRVAVVDGHPDQPGRILFEAELKDGRPVAFHYQSCGYPFLDLKGHHGDIERAIELLLKAETSK